MMNIGNMMKQVQEMQGKMAEMQNRLGDNEVIGQSGGGMITVTMNGKAEMKKIKIDAKLVDPAEIEMLEDLIVAAFNDARAKSEAMSQAEMSKLTAGLPLPPGMKLPF